MNMMTLRAFALSLTLAFASPALAQFGGGTGGGGSSGIVSGDCSVIAGVITCTKTNGTTFGTSAIIDTGTSGTKIPLLNGANTWSAAQTVTPSQAANTSADGLVLVDTTAASAGNQQYSPRLRLTGQGWKTNSTAASQTVDWIVENQPVQGTANPNTNLVFSQQVNAGGYNSIFAMALASVGASSLTGQGSVLTFTAAGISASGPFTAGSTLTATGNVVSTGGFVFFGGSAVTNAAWKRSGTTLLARLGDDSADAPISASTGAFSGAVSIANSLNSVSPTSPNRTVTISVGGTTVYLAAKTTND